jgi:hypothetical protein
MNPDYWFADPLDEDERGGKSEQAIAVSACERCPIKRPCAQFAMDNEIEYGVYGGMVPHQRLAYKRRVEASN